LEKRKLTAQKAVESFDKVSKLNQSYFCRAFLEDA
jgi:hypothetical protein